MRSERLRPDRRRCALAAALLVVAGASACAPTRVAHPALAQAGAAENELDFWQALETRSLLANDDALHGLFLIADGQDGCANFAARETEARERGWIGGATLVADEAATVGLVCRAVCRILEIRGGATLQLFGPSERYCTRELVFAGLMPPRSAQQAMRGLEFVDLAGRVDDRQRSAAAAEPGGARS